MRNLNFSKPLSRLPLSDNYFISRSHLLFLRNILPSVIYWYSFYPIIFPMKTFLTIVIIRAAFVALVSCTRASFMGDQIYSVYLERTNHITEADMWLVEYNAELDKSLGIQIDLLCNARWRNVKQCWYQMLFDTGNEFTPYRGF